MLLVEHRVNTIAKLQQVPAGRGVEIDIRDYDGHLRLAHDPFVGGELLDDFLTQYKHALLILNVKCDGLEKHVLKLLQKHRIEKYFFLDVAIPTLVKLVEQGVHQIAVRYSEYEPLALAETFGGKVEWVWVDCFNQLPLDPNTYSSLRRHFKICLVSPELQSHPRTMITSFRTRLETMPIDAVCTDYCDDWV